MQFSAKSRYALRLMEELALHEQGACTSLKEVSESQQISLKYLEQIVTPLARAHLVKSERGSQGGYRLTRLPADYTAGEIIRAIEGALVPIPCLGDQPNLCPRHSACRTLPFWVGLEKVMNAYMDSVTLADLLQQDFPPEG
ncbi:MAG: Rrf2 family transcriptional regulator [Faecalibacterium sp.]|jgi:Rrf2 family protein|nr:Rrf2 family transcriptional regulator [Faecalibacterium sp.]